MWVLLFEFFIWIFQVWGHWIVSSNIVWFIFGLKSKLIFIKSLNVLWQWLILHRKYTQYEHELFFIYSWVNTLLREKLKIHRIKNIYHGYSIGRFKQKKNLRVILFLQYDVCYFINHVFLIGTPKGSFKLHEHLWLQCVCNSVSKYVTHSSVAVFSHVYKKSLKQTASYYHESK